MELKSTQEKRFSRLDFTSQKISRDNNLNHPHSWLLAVRIYIFKNNKKLFLNIKIFH